MKILFLASGISLGSGGIQAFNHYLVNALIENGHHLRAISLNDIGNQKVKADYQLIAAGNYRFIRKVAFVVSALIQIFRFRPGLLICGHVNFSLFCAMLSIIFKMPYLTLTHGIEAWSLKGPGIFGLLHSKRIISVSNFTKNKILRQLSRYPGKNISVLPDTVDTQKFTPSPKPTHLMSKYGLRDSDKVILTVSRLSKKEQYKGYDKVIMALPGIIERMPNVKYIISGCGDDKERVRDLIESKGLGDRVILTGFIPNEEVVDYYNLCDCFVMPSRGEGFGMVFIEALACGKPVIAGNQDGSREALLDGKLGLLVDPDDINQIAEAIIKVLRAGVASDLLDRNFLRQSVIKNFGLDRFSSGVSQLLNGIE
jgi:glycosyltransferase involved in cell wall biosynthesis